MEAELMWPGVHSQLGDGQTLSSTKVTLEKMFVKINGLDSDSSWMNRNNLTWSWAFLYTKYWSLAVQWPNISKGAGGEELCLSCCHMKFVIIKLLIWASQSNPKSEECETNVLPNPVILLLWSFNEAYLTAENSEYDQLLSIWENGDKVKEYLKEK